MQSSDYVYEGKLKNNYVCEVNNCLWRSKDTIILYQKQNLYIGKHLYLRVKPVYGSIHESPFF